jgi:ABC-2 type transport system ATP-binding protein
MLGGMTEDPGRVVVSGLSKTFGAVTAVDDLSFTVEPGMVTGFLGPNGAGKTTTLRMLLGLVTPTRGVATIGGLRYADLPDPTRTVGASLEATGFHPGRTARDHLRVLCAAAGLPAQRADETLALVGLADAARRRAGGFSLGMRQRLALAAALLGDPHVLVLDEPANGLDPEGIAWLRGFLRYLADSGRTVLVSSHVLSEVKQTVDQVVIISRGRLVRQATLEQLTASDIPAVRVRTPDAARLVPALVAQGFPVQRQASDTLLVTGVDAATVGQLALREQAELHELVAESSDLEQVFLELTAVPALTDADAVPSPAGTLR